MEHVLETQQLLEKLLNAEEELKNATLERDKYLSKLQKIDPCHYSRSKNQINIRYPGEQNEAKRKKLYKIYDDYRLAVKTRDKTCVVTGLTNEQAQAVGCKLVAAHIFQLVDAHQIHHSKHFDRANGITLVNKLEESFDRHDWCFDSKGLIHISPKLVQLMTNDDEPGPGPCLRSKNQIGEFVEGKGINLNGTFLDPECVELRFQQYTQEWEHRIAATNTLVVVQHGT
jgi:hypothetical protein